MSDEQEFTWFKKVGRAVAEVAERDRAMAGELALALSQYGTYGIEPDLPFPYDTLFWALADDIDHSIQKRGAGAKGGRPRKAPAPEPEAQPEATELVEEADGASTEPDGTDQPEAETMVSKTENLGFDTPETMVSQPENLGFDNPETMVSQGGKPNTVQGNTVQGSTGQERECAREDGAHRPTKAKRFRPPTVDEVRAYCHDRHNAVDPERFCDFYGSKGWVIGKSPMRDWRAAVRTWERRDRQPSPTAREVSDVDLTAYDSADVLVL